MNTLNAIHPGALPSFNSVATTAFLPLLVMIGGFLFAQTRRRASRLAKPPFGLNLQHFGISRILQLAFSVLLLALAGILALPNAQAQNQPKPSYEWGGESFETMYHRKINFLGLAYSWYKSYEREDKLHSKISRVLSYARSETYYSKETIETYGITSSRIKTTERKNGTCYTEYWNFWEDEDGDDTNYWRENNQCFLSINAPDCKGSWTERSSVQKTEFVQRPYLYAKTSPQQIGRVSWDFVFQFTKYNRRSRNIGTDVCTTTITLNGPSVTKIFVPCSGRRSRWSSTKYVCYDGVSIYEN